MRAALRATASGQCESISRSSAMSAKVGLLSLRLMIMTKEYVPCSSETEPLVPIRASPVQIDCAQ